MKRMQYLVARNLLLFVRNRKNVVLCFFSVFVVLSLYVFFLRDFMISSVMESGLPGKIGKEFTDRLMLSGLLVVVNTTTTFGIMQQAVLDVQSGIQKDFLIAPVEKLQILAGYWISAGLVSFCFTAFTFLGMELYFYFSYGAALSTHSILWMLLSLIACSIINSGLMMCFIQFIKDTTTFSTFGNLYGMMIGFLAGTYLPYQLYPKRLQSILFYFPPMQLTSILRRLCFNDLSETLFGGKQGDLATELFKTYGVTLYHGEHMLVQRQQWAILCYAMAAILILLGVMANKRSS